MAVSEGATITPTAEKNEEGLGKNQNGKVPFQKLFSFADETDMVLMTVGTIGAVVNGLAMPLMTILFGEVINYFGKEKNSKDLIDAVSKV